MGKGFAIGAAALAALAIIAAFVGTDLERGGDFVYTVVIQMFSVAYLLVAWSILIASITMTAVGDAAMDMIEEIRGNFAKSQALWRVTLSQIMPNV